MSFKPEDVVAGMPVALIPPQKPVVDLLSAGDRVDIFSFPPLSQVTKSTSDHVSIVVGLRVHQTEVEGPWQVAASFSPLGSEEWTDENLHSTASNETPITLHVTDSSISSLYFTTSIPLKTAIRFTLKFRKSAEQPWRVARDELRIEDAIVVPDTQSQLPEHVHDILDGLSKKFTVKSAMSQCSATKLWVMEAPVSALPPNSDESLLSKMELGRPWGKQLLRWFALARAWAPWIAPWHGKTTFSLDKDAMFCSFLSDEGNHVVLLPVTGIDHITSVIRSKDDGGAVLHIRSDSLKDVAAKVIVAVGKTFENTSAACLYHARGLFQIQEQTISDSLINQPQQTGEAPRPEWMESWYDGLGFCTWNALGQNLSDKKILDALDALAENKIMITNLIIDDNWQDIDRTGDGQFQYGWNGFQAEPKAFPQGLGPTVSTIRSKHPHIQHVAVWHALLGYWGGITPGGSIASSYKTTKVVREEAKRRNFPLGGPMTVVATEDVRKFYDDFYRFLASSGVDGVKTDAQFMIDMWLGAESRRELANEYLDSWTIASLRHFSNRAISCMSLTPHIIFHSQLPRNRPAIPVRTSDDFTPAIPASHPWHVWTNAHNGLLTQYLNILPDWDMFQTSHDYSGFHAAARCVSGGPIYITDVPGEHDKSLIDQMTGVTIRGKTVIFRTSVPGKSIDQYVDYTDDALLKVGTYHGGAVSGTPILGVFNVALRPLTDIIPLSRFPGTNQQKKYVVRSHSSGLVSPPIQPGTRASLLSVSLGVRGYDIFSAYPLSTFDNSSGLKVHVATLGLVGKMAGAAAVISSDIEKVTGGRVFVDTRVKALGVLGIYISGLPNMDIGRDFMATIQGAVVPESAVSVSKQDRSVLAVDVEAAWKEMRLDNGWSNELELKLYFNIDNVGSGEE